MASDSGPSEVIARVVAALTKANVPYMLTGSLASSLHGIPRSTQDIDIVIATDRPGLERLLGQFPEAEFYVSRDAAMQALRLTSLFNVIELASGWKIDFILRKARDFSHVEFERRMAAEALGISIHVATPEDVVLAKLEWAKRSESEKQLEDAAGVLESQGDRLDRAYLARWVGELGLEAQWDAVVRRVPQAGRTAFEEYEE